VCVFYTCILRCLCLCLCVSDPATAGCISVASSFGVFLKKRRKVNPRGLASLPAAVFFKIEIFRRAHLRITQILPSTFDTKFEHAFILVFGILSRYSGRTHRERNLLLGTTSVLKVG